MGEGSSLAAVEKASPLPWGEGQGEGRDGNEGQNGLAMTHPSATAHDGALPAIIREQARAKVNLTLHVLGKRADGYHELDSLVVFADLCDELSFTPAPEDRLSMEGPFAGAVDGENLILKAKRAVSGWLGREIHGDFRLDKHIPVAAGLGGGSSDAAAALRILLRAYGDPACRGELYREGRRRRRGRSGLPL